MKFFHLSDLHLGKRVNEFSMLEDQAYILNQIIAIACQERPDGILLAGDIYDKPVPPAEAVQLFDQFLTELAHQDIAVFVISGNHDSAERLAFGSRLMESRRVYLSPVYDGAIQTISLTDQYGPLSISLLPFLRPAQVRHSLEGEEPSTFQEAVQAVLSRLTLPPAQRHILVAHQFVTGAARCDSEEIFVGGLDNIDASLFDRFDYVALGHIHSPQAVGRETVRYCGTPLKYSFSESGQEKSITVVELRSKGEVRLSQIPLTPLRDMRIIRGTYLELTNRSFYEGSSTQDYIQAILTDEEDILDGMQKLRVIYPNLMRLDYDNRRTRESRAIGPAEDVPKKTELQLLSQFYQMQNNQPLSQKQADFAQALLTRLQEEKEAHS